MLVKGQQAPNFDLMGEDGQTHRLRDHKGQPTIVFFCVKDLDTGYSKKYVISMSYPGNFLV